VRAIILLTSMSQVTPRATCPAGPYDAPVSPDPPTEQSALAEALTRVGDRWTLLVIDALLEGPRRFGELEAAVPGIAPNVLTQRLRRLERDGLVLAQPYSRKPPRFLYELTESARDLAAPLRLLAGWGAAHGAGLEGPRHEACGTPMELRWWCPVCGEALPAGTSPEGPEEELHFA
jgi:DNA-binding HxlR family transcriptional regulator